MADMERNLAYGLKTKISEAITAGTLTPGTLIITSDAHDLAFINASGTVEYLYQTQLAAKAPVNNPTFTGTVTLAQNPTENMQAATKSYVDSMIVNSKMTPGIVNTENPLPTIDYTAGQMYRVAAAGTYAGNVCEVGDLIIVLKDYAAGTASNADFLVVQANIDGAVTGPASATDLNIAVFDGATGKVIKDSAVSIASLNDVIAKAHTHANKTVLDTFDKTQTEIYNDIDAKATKATTLAGYGITDAYTKTETDKEISDAITESEGKTTTAIATAKSEAIATAGTNADTKIADKVGAIGDGNTVKKYVDDTVATAKTEAINTAGTNADSKISAKVGEITGTVKDYVDEAASTAESNALAAAKTYVDNSHKVIVF